MMRWFSEWPRPAIGLSLSAAALVLILIGWAWSSGDAGAEAGAFALIGVLAGGLITAATTWAFERRREEADLRQARRLVGDEIHTQWMHHDLLLEVGRLPEHDIDQLMPTALWEENKATLARHLTDKVWGFLATVEHAVRRTGAILARGEPNSPISADWLAKLEEGRRLTATAYRELTGRDP
jgi:hypothetical protein